MLKKILKQWRLIQEVKSFRKLLSQEASIQDKVQKVLHANNFKFQQKQTEIIKLLMILQEMQARRMYEF